MIGIVCKSVRADMFLLFSFLEPTATQQQRRRTAREFKVAECPLPEESDPVFLFF
jgi:hypothetical protein